MDLYENVVLYRQYFVIGGTSGIEAIPLLNLDYISIKYKICHKLNLLYSFFSRIFSAQNSPNEYG